MPYDFETLIDRRGTSSVKWDHGTRIVGRDDLLPLWVADMDFRLPAEIQGAIEQRVSHGVFGYTIEPESYFEAAIGWFADRHAWRIERPWILTSPGVLASLTAAILSLTEPGDGIIIQPPVYYPFALRVQASGRAIIENPLARTGNGYRMDLDALERVIDSRARMLILSSPHNPVARVWTREEIEGLSRVCHRRGILIVSDEIHCDLILPGHRHVPVAAVSPEAAALTVTLVSATKSFNLAGLGGSLAIVPDGGLRARLARTQESLWPPIANAVAAAASEAAWRKGGPWLDALLRRVEGNYRLLVEELGSRVPAARVLPLEGTYLAWIDLSGLGLDDDEVSRRLRAPGGVWLDEGRKFGRGGQGFQRLNLACPAVWVVEAAERMARALA